LTSRVEKFESAEICIRYELAPPTLFQLSVGLVAISVALFTGVAKVGAAGGAMMVVKLRELE
jgi:hypothetical protein